jgi:hypothetical protein
MTGRLLLISFFVIQILVDLGHSVNAFPFVHYGMFSESFRQPDSLTVYEITVDGRQLKAEDFRIYRWDQVQNPLLAIDRQIGTEDNAFDKEKLRAAMGFTGTGALYRHLAPNLDNDPATAARFPGWYKIYLGKILGRPVRTLQVDKAWYRYDGSQFLLMKKQHRINI